MGPRPRGPGPLDPGSPSKFKSGAPHQKNNPSVAFGTLSVTSKTSPKWWMSSEQNIYFKIPTIHGELFPYYINLCLKQNKSNNEKILL